MSEAAISLRGTATSLTAEISIFHMIVLALTILPIGLGLSYAHYKSVHSRASTRQRQETTSIRLRGIPYDYDRADVQRLIRDASCLGKEAVFIVKSLACSPYARKEQVATLLFSSTPAVLRGKNSEWKADLVDNGKTISLMFDTHFRGFTPLHHSAESECKVDLIALSGLGGHAFGSFKERGTDYMWLRDSLTSDLLRVRILIYGYDSQLANSSSFQNISDLGRQLRSSICDVRGHLPISTKPRPLILLGHSLGGILIKQALIEMHYAASSHDDLKAVSAVLLFGVPSHGMSIESLIPMVGNQPNRFLLESLGKSSSVLQDQDRSLAGILHGHDSKVVCFYETKESPTAIRIGHSLQIRPFFTFGWTSQSVNLRWAMDGPPAILVDQHSATLHRAWSESNRMALPINKNHSNIAKFSQNDEYYTSVLRHLSALEHDAQTNLLATAENRTEVQLSRTSTSETLVSLERSRDYSKIELECLQSFAFEQQDYRRQKIINVANGCIWLLKHEKYISWTKQTHGLLWIKGKPGAGKSTLMKFITHYHETHHSVNKPLVVSFFFSARGSDLEKKPLGLVRSLLHQLLTCFEQHLVDLTAIYEEKCRSLGDFEQKWNWTYEEVRDHLSSVISRVTTQRQICIFVDALDECGEENAVQLEKWFIQLIKIAASSQAALKICFSCRHYPIINFTEKCTINVEDENEMDITDFVKEELVGVFEQDELHIIQSLLLQKANGVFQWVALVIPQIQALQRKGRGFRQVQQSISLIPSDLHMLYAQLLQGLDNEENKLSSTILLQWLCFTTEPLTIEAVQHAMAISTDQQFRWLDDYLDIGEYSDDMNTFKRRLIDLSQGLAEVKTIGSKRIVQLIHQSVKDYLIGTGFEQLGICLPGSAVRVGNIRLAEYCIQYLSLQDRRLWRAMKYEKACEEFPLLQYVTLAWPSHIAAAEIHGAVQSDLLNVIGRLTPDVFEEWIYFVNSLDRFGIGPYPFDVSLLHVAVRKGLWTLVEWVTTNNPATVNQRDGDSYSPLELAVTYGYTKCVKMLLRQKGIKVNTKNSDGQTPLHLASIEGDEEMVLTLLRYEGIEVNGKDDDGRTPLHLAAFCGQPQIIALLLQHKEVEVNSRDNLGETPLHLAVANGSTECVQILLQRGNGVEVNQKDNHKQTPLHLAVRFMNSEILQLLLRHDLIEPNHSNKPGWTPLHLAVFTMHIGIVRLLCQHALTSVNCQDDDGLTPLHLAVYKGNIRIMLLLLRHTLVHVNSIDKNGRTPLYFAVSHGSSEGVALLLHYQDPVDPLDEEDFTMLTDMAVEDDEPEIVNLLRNFAATGDCGPLTAIELEDQEPI